MRYRDFSFARRCSRRYQLKILTRQYSVNRRADILEMPFQGRPVIGPELQNSYAAVGHVLLIPHVLVSHDYQLEFLLLGQT